MNWIRSSLVLPVIFLTGCALNSAPPTEPLLLPWPSPMATCEISSVEIDNQGRVILSYQDNINIAVCERDMFRYIKDLTQIICTHQITNTRCKELNK